MQNGRLNMGLIIAFLGIHDLSMSHDSIICYYICTINTTPYFSSLDCVSKMRLLYEMCSEVSLYPNCHSACLKCFEITINMQPTCLCLFTASPSGQCTGLCTSSFFPRALTQLNFVSHHQHYILAITTPISPPAPTHNACTWTQPWTLSPPTTPRLDRPRSSTLTLYPSVAVTSCFPTLCTSGIIPLYTTGLIGELTVSSLRSWYL